MHFTPVKQAAVILTCLIGALLVLPNFFAKETLASWPSWVPTKQLSLGLDLRGGAHLLLSMETNEVRKDWLDTLRDDARRRLREAKIGVTGLGVANNAVQVRLAKPEDADAALKELRGMIQPIGNLLVGSSGSDIDIKRGEGGVITITPTEPGLQQRIGNAIGAAVISAVFYAASRSPGPNREATYGHAYGLALGVSVVFALAAIGLAVRTVRHGQTL